MQQHAVKVIFVSESGQSYRYYQKIIKLARVVIRHSTSAKNVWVSIRFRPGVNKLKFRLICLTITNSIVLQRTKTYKHVLSDSANQVI